MELESKLAKQYE